MPVTRSTSVKIDYMFCYEDPGNSTFVFFATEGGDLPPVTSSVRQISSVPGYIMPGLPRKQFQDVLAKSASQPIAGDAHESKMEKRRFNEYLPTR